MKLSSSQLEAFFTVAKTKSFTKAAAEIHVTQSALSQRIINLETSLETTLFIRDRAGLELTPAAQDLLRYCQHMESLETEFLGGLQSQGGAGLSGIIRIAGFSSVLRSVVLPTLSPLLKEHPALQLQVQTRELDQLLPLLKSGEVDFVILDQKIAKDEIETVDMGLERNFLVEATSGTVKDVYLDHDVNDETTAKYLRLLKRAKTKIRRHFLDDIYGILDGVKLGLGRAVLPQHLIANHKGLKLLNPKVVLEVPVVLCFYRQPYYSKLHHEVCRVLQSNKILASAL